MSAAPPEIALRDRHCRRDAPLLDAAAVDERLGRVRWRREGDAIVRTFRFAGWLETIAFVDALAWMCHVEDHHPALEVGFDHVRVRFSTHSAGGLTDNDFVCAARADALVAGDG